LPDRRTEPAASERGGVTVEASLIMPVFLMVFILLVAIIRLAMTQMALQDAAVQTVRLTAAHIYPAQLAVQAGKGEPASPGIPAADEQSSRSGDRSAPDAVRTAPIEDRSDPSGGRSAPPDGRSSPSGFGKLAAELAGLLPEPAGPLLEAALRGEWDEAADIAAAPLGEAVFGPLVRELAAPSALDPGRIRITRLSLPDLSDGGEAYFRIRLAYDFPLGLPFTGSHITLSADAEERVWIADPVPARTYPDEEDGPGGIVIVSIEPSPLRPGRKAKLTAIGDPNAKLSLTVWYKSGKSRAKNLGEKMTDAHGIVTWEWHVSGNTTPGVWELEVASEDGAKAHSYFVVRRAGDAAP
jgi:hypothetical protein